LFNLMSSVARFSRTCASFVAFGINGVPEHPGESDLCGLYAVAGSDSAERPAVDEPPLLDRRIGLNRYASRAAPGQKPCFDAATP
jgi:hypothetical protein